MITINRMKELKNLLFSAVLADILDELGIRNSALDDRIRPLSPNMKIMGRAFTILAVDVYEQPKDPYKLELAAVDNLKKGDVVVAKINGSISSHCGFWGEILSTAALSHGCLGVVIDGHTRDAQRIIKMNFPIFVRGFSPYDSKGRTDIVAYQIPIKSGNTLINPGDIIFADMDGIVCIPKKLEDVVIKKALNKLKYENIVKQELLRGASAQEVFDKYHIL